MDEDRLTETQELRLDQLRREADEQEKAERARTEAETDQHERRADKAEYLRRKLEERDAAERAAEEPGEG